MCVGGYLYCQIISYFEAYNLLNLGCYFFKWRSVLYFFLKTGNRHRPNSFCVVIYEEFVLGSSFSNFRSWQMTSLPYPVHVNANFPYVTNRMWPEVEKGTAQHKFLIDYDAKRIRSISVTGFEKKIQNWPSLKKITT